MVTATSDFRVGNLMSIDPVVIDPSALVSEAETLLKTHRISGMPVVANGVAVGVISQTDIVIARSSVLTSGNWSRLRVRHIMTDPGSDGSDGDEHPASREAHDQSAHSPTGRDRR